MVWRLGRFLVGGVFLPLICGCLASARHGDSEQDLLPRIQRASNPVKRAKYEIRLGRVKLHEAIEACNQGHVDQCHQILGDYLERMKSSWETLRRSGRRASRQPQGFKELDIALREDSRLLEDLKHRVPYLDRDPIEKTAQGIEEIRGEVLRALFPDERPAADMDRFVSKARASVLSEHFIL